MERRDFLKYLGAGGVGTALGILFGKKTTPPGAHVIPYVIPPEDVVPGVATWYASLCTQCPAGCGIYVRVMEGRAKKIEGNPDHPVNRGKLCARGQAALQALYNPDRIKGPMKRTGQRGEARFTRISWDDALSILTEKMKTLASERKTRGLYLLTPTLRGHLDILFTDFMKAFGSPNYFQYELFQHRNLLLAGKRALGLDTLPHYDIENTRYLLSFGADFSTTWLSPVNLSYGYGQMRQKDPKARGRLVQIEPRMSLTGANADEFVPVRPGTEGILALAIAHVIVKEGLYRGPDRKKWAAVLRDSSPEATAPVTEVKKERVYSLAREFATTRPSLAIGGETVSSYTNGVENLVAINILNHLAGNLNAEGGLRANPERFYNVRFRSGVDYGKNLKTLAEDAAAGKVAALVLYNSNPLFTAPAAMKMAEGLSRVPFIASLSSFMDETTAMADLILPVHTSLEDWGDDFASPSAGRPVATFMQPAVSPYYDTKGAGDIFIALATSLGGRPAEVFSAWSDFYTYLKDAWKGIYKANRLGPAKDLDYDWFWDKLLQKGGAWPETSAPRRIGGASPARVRRHLPKGPAAFEGERKKYPFYLLTYPQAGHLDGRGANLPWLQELPDPLTTVVWGSWVEINPSTARRMDIKEGDLIRIESPYGAIEAPAYIYPGIRPDAVAVPVGQGHSVYGRYAKKRGVNPLEILPPVWDGESGSLALNSTRVSIKKVGVRKGLVKIEATSREYGRPIVETVSHREYKKLTREKA